MFPKVVLSFLMAVFSLCVFSPEVVASNDDMTSDTADQAAFTMVGIPDNEITNQLPSLIRQGVSRELLSALRTVTPNIGGVAKKTKTFNDKQLGVTLRYPSTVKYRIGKSVDEKIAQADDYFRMYEFTHKDEGITMGYSMVSTTMGPLYWSFVTQGNKEEVVETAAEGLTLGGKALALQAGYSTTTYAGHILHNDFASYNGTVFMGVYTGSVKLPGGVFMGVAVFYSSVSAINKERGILTAEQAQEMIATLLTKSKLDTKKVQKHFSSE